MFLLPSINLKLRPKILDMKPGTRVVSNSFDMEDWTPDETAEVTEGCENWCRAMLWIVPAKVGGTWHMGQGEAAITQTFQVIAGTLTSGGTATPITGKLHGAQILFTAGDTQGHGSREWEHDGGNLHRGERGESAGHTRGTVKGSDERGGRSVGRRRAHPARRTRTSHPARRTSTGTSACPACRAPSAGTSPSRRARSHPRASCPPITMSSGTVV